MMGLILKDFYTLRQYVKTLLITLALFAVISIGLDNPASFYEGFIVLMSMMMSIYTFSYDNLAKWDRFGLSLPITRKEVVAGKYIVSLLLCFIGAVLSFTLSSIILFFKPVTDFGVTEHLLSLAGVIMLVMIFFSILLPLIFKFGVEKSRMLLIALFAAPTAIIISLQQLGISLPSSDTIFSVFKLLPLVAIVLYILSFLLSVRIYSSTEI
jgi:ABC-2 type transport system permease protein